MSIRVEIDLGYEFAVKSPYAKVFALLADVPKSASHFPKLARLVDMGQGAYRWEMEKVGTEQVNIQTVYASRYKSDARKGSVVWTPVEGVGNAQVSGSWAVVNRKATTGLTLRIHGTVEVALPALMRGIVVPVVQAEFEQLVDTYVDNLIATFGGEA